MESSLKRFQKSVKISSFLAMYDVKSTNTTIGLPATFQRPTRILRPSWAALSRQGRSSLLSSRNSGFCFVSRHTSGPIRICLLSICLDIFSAFVAITVCIPPTLLHTSQLTSNK